MAITADLHPFVTHTGLTVKTAFFLFLTVTHSSSMKGPRHNFHAERQLADGGSRSGGNSSSGVWGIVVGMALNEMCMPDSAS